MTTQEQNKAMIRRMTDEFYNQGNVDSAEQFFADTYVHHDSASPQVRDRNGRKAELRAFLIGCPDLHIAIDVLLADGETVTKRWTLHARHTGDLSGLPPSGKRITVSGWSCSGWPMARSWSAGSATTASA
ncbi:MAG: ester cyclase [Anaerolineae bacterium]|nr:ester cyclase [Anaerolineae bacterium]